jgi:cytochrome b561
MYKYKRWNGAGFLKKKIIYQRRYRIMGKKTINIRAFVSVSLFVLIIILFITGIGILVIDVEEMVDPEVYISMILNPEIRKTYFFVEVLEIIKDIHTVAGFLFIGLSIIHIVKNWKVLKSYIKRRKNNV